MTVTIESVLSDDVLQHCAERAPIYDRDNKFFSEEWSNGVDHGGLWPAKLVSAKFRATEGAKRLVDMAMEVSGGSGMFKRNELERLYRDVRCGGFHPANGPVSGG